MKTTESVRVDLETKLLASIYAHPETWLHAVDRKASITVIEGGMWRYELTAERFKEKFFGAYSMLETELHTEPCLLDILNPTAFRRVLSLNWGGYTDQVRRLAQKMPAPQLIYSSYKVFTPSHGYMPYNLMGGYTMEVAVI